MSVFPLENPSIGNITIPEGTYVTPADLSASFGKPTGADNGYVLIMTALVQLMTPGVAFFYGGLVGERAVVNTMMLSFGCMGVVTVLWGLIGYSMAFGPVAPIAKWIGDNALAAPAAISSTRVIGNNQLALFSFLDNLRQNGWLDASGAYVTWTAEGPLTPSYFSISEQTYAMFQLMFAIITPALISGAVVGKIKFNWFMLFVALWHLTVYCPLAHWIFFYDGWLFTYGVLDFAGGLVVHCASGVSALVLTWLLGSRGRKHTEPHSIPYVLLGSAMLWFGWFGFNAGSALGAGAGNQAAKVFVNTQFGAAMSMVTWAFLEVAFGNLDDGYFKGRPTAIGAATSCIVGLVGITPACAYVTPMWALGIGFLTAIPCFFAPRLVKYCGIDDRLDCFAFHGVGGITGALLTGLFATDFAPPSTVRGAFYFNAPQFGIQIVGVLVTILLSIIGTTVIFYVMIALAYLLKTDIRIPEEHSDDIDVSQHGETAYKANVDKSFTTIYKEGSVALRIPQSTAETAPNPITVKSETDEPAA
jgi:Amt family ammonium transporter